MTRLQITSDVGVISISLPDELSDPKCLSAVEHAIRAVLLARGADTRTKLHVLHNKVKPFGP